jgi:GntR family transcriptional regulator, transcriptional repressor for pyruvate dehydrogenase complex
MMRPQLPMKMPTMENQNAASRLPRKRRSLAQELVTVLSEQIRDGELKRGDKLPTESAIMEAHGISRTVVREAISRLQAAGQVETRHGIGTFVLDTPSPSGFRIDPATVVTLGDVLAILELRISLEVESAGLAAQRRSDEQLAAMRAALDELEALNAIGSDAAAADFQFHLQIALATGNRYFTDIMSHLGTSIIPRARLNSARIVRDDQQQYLQRLGREHEDIYAAIARQDGESARAAMRLHLTNSRERLRQAHEEAQAQQG